MMWMISDDDVIISYHVSENRGIIVSVSVTALIA